MLSYTTAAATVQQVLLKHYESKADANSFLQNVIQHLKTCRTAALGYHVYRCSNEECAHINTSTIAAVIGTAPIAVL